MPESRNFGNLIKCIKPYSYKLACGHWAASAKRSSKLSSKDDSILKDLTKLIPGYGSYVQQESRREDDRLTREFLVNRLSDCKSRLDALGQSALAAGDLDTPARIEKVRAAVDLAQSRLSAALEGYAGWFGERKVDVALLEEIGKLDANLVSLVDQIDQFASEQLKQSTFDLSEISGVVDLLHARIDRRTQVLKAGA